MHANNPPDITTLIENYFRSNTLYGAIFQVTPRPAARFTKQSFKYQCFIYTSLSSIRFKILPMPRQHRCRGMYKILKLPFNYYTMSEIGTEFDMRMKNR